MELDSLSSEVCESLTLAASAATGYTQPVEVKGWHGGIAFVHSAPAHDGATPLDSDEPPDEELTASEMALRRQFEYVSSRHMLPRHYGGGQTSGRNAEGDKVSPWDAFAAKYTIPYLYGVVKTHKWPYGWRFISGGTKLALNLVGDWVHVVLQGILPDVHQLAAEALAGALPSDPMPCSESFIIRDSRDVVRRIRDLESRRRAGFQSHREGEGQRPPRWQDVQFEVADFTTLYPSLPHADIMQSLTSLLRRVFRRHRTPIFDGDAQTGWAPQWIRVVRGNPREDMGVSWAKGTQRRDGSTAPPEDIRNLRHFDCESVLGDVRFILAQTHMTAGDDLFRQQLGIPMGLSCSPMIAVLMLAHYEITMLERMREAAERPMGSVIDTPAGRMALTPTVKDKHLGLAARVSRCCRAIDDVLFVDLTRAERTWVKANMYPSTLELKTVCCSPERIDYLDLSIRYDRGGFFTTLYDKRDALRDAGKMDVVRRFPHPSSSLSEQCRYGCLVSFLHRARRCDTRCALFIRHAAERILDMYTDGYEAGKLLERARRFVRTFHNPHFRWRSVFARVERTFERLRGDRAQPVHTDLFPEGTPMAVMAERTRAPRAAKGGSQTARGEDASTTDAAEGGSTAQQHAAGADEGDSSQASDVMSHADSLGVDSDVALAEFAASDVPALTDRQSQIWSALASIYDSGLAGGHGLGGSNDVARVTLHRLAAELPWRPSTDHLMDDVLTLDGRSLNGAIAGVPKPDAQRDSLVYLSLADGPSASSPWGDQGQPPSMVVSVSGRPHVDGFVHSVSPSHFDTLSHEEAEWLVRWGAFQLRSVLNVTPLDTSFHTPLSIRRAAEWLFPEKSWAPSTLMLALRRLATQGECMSWWHRTSPQEEGTDRLAHIIALATRSTTLVCVKPSVREQMPVPPMMSPPTPLTVHRSSEAAPAPASRPRPWTNFREWHRRMMASVRDNEPLASRAFRLARCIKCNTPTRAYGTSLQSLSAVHRFPTCGRCTPVLMLGELVSVSDCDDEPLASRAFRLACCIQCDTPTRAYSASFHSLCAVRRFPTCGRCTPVLMLGDLV